MRLHFLEIIMALTQQEIYQRHKDRYHNDPEYKEKVLRQKSEYYQRIKTTTEFQEKKKEYNKRNAAYFNKKTKEYNAARPFHYAFRRLRMRAKQHNLPFDLDADYLTQIWSGSCAIFGTPLQYPYSTDRMVDDKATIDRIVPDLGYVKGNVCWVSNRANIIKSFGTVEEHRKIVEYMTSHTKGKIDVA
jgi:hypothetical protein